jgi:hypothetical protein
LPDRPTDDELFAIKDRADAYLTTLPNVTSVGLGGRVRRGERINELVLKVHVDTKVPESELPPEERIPPEFEGIPTDVVEMPHTGTTSQTAPTGTPEIPLLPRDTERKRPLIGGKKIMADLPGVGWGTLGCLLVKVGDATKVYALTNWHVVVHGSTVPTLGTTKAGQPTNSDSVTKCCSHIIGTIVAGGRDGVRDAAAVELEPGMQWTADIAEIGAVAGRHTVTGAEAGTHPAVRKRGMRSRLTGGTIDSIGQTKVVNGVTFNNVIVVTPNANPALPAGTPYFFSRKGDSGSALVNDANEVVGLHFAAPHPPYSGAVAGWALPIDVVVNGFSAHEGLVLEVAVAVMPGVVNTVPGTPMVALPPEVAPAPAGDFADEPERERVRVPIGAAVLDAPPAAALARLERDLDRSERGRALICLWLEHQDELLRLLNSNRRVATVWHRSGGAALFQLLVRMISQPELALPTALHGRPLTACLDRLYAVFHRFASPALQQDLSRAREGLPELGGLDYDGICAALAAG